MDLTAAMLSQSARAFRVALECQVTLDDIQSRNNSSVDKLAVAEEEIKRFRVEAKAAMAEKTEDNTKLDSDGDRGSVEGSSRS